MLNRKKIVVIEQNEIWQNSVVHLINSTDKFIVSGCFETWVEASPNLLRIKPDVVLIEIFGLDRNGIPEISVIKEKLPSAEILILTSLEDDTVVLGALRAGASGYILKSANFVEIILGLEEIIKGGSPLSSKIARKVIHNLHRNPDTPFTRRELEVLGLVAKGHSSSQISQRLFISRDTTKTHIRNIYSKLDVNKKADAIELAHRRRYI
jgi:DNA-binding NarL/FixJ family response regulator